VDNSYSSFVQQNHAIWINFIRWIRIYPVDSAYLGFVQLAPVIHINVLHKNTAKYHLLNMHNRVLKTGVFVNISMSSITSLSEVFVNISMLSITTIVCFLNQNYNLDRLRVVHHFFVTERRSKYKPDKHLI
jgi:hypothetical protein